MTSSEPPLVVLVCRANRIRSPMAEHLLRAELGRAGLDWTVASCGTHARAGLPMDPAAQGFLRGRGVPVADAWRTTPLDHQLLERADLILTAETAQRSNVLQVLPSGLRKTFALRQFARIADQAGRLPSDFRAGETQELFAAVARARALQPVSAADDSIPDPAGQWPARLMRCAELIDQAVTRIVRAFPGGSALR